MALPFETNTSQFWPDMDGEIHIRWMIRRDMPDVLNIEHNCFPNAWNEEEFKHCLRNRNTIGMVSEVNDELVGFMVYELCRNRIHMLNFAVHENARRKGVGAAMVSKLTNKLSAERRNRITIEIRESNLDGQLFFKAMGFRCISVLKGLFDDTDEDAYLMQYRFGDHT